MPTVSARPRLIMTAFTCDPNRSAEGRVGWHRALEAARDFDVTVVYNDFRQPATLQRLAARQTSHPPKFLRLGSSTRHRLLRRTPGGFFVAVRRWHRRAYELAAALHAEQPFDLAHHVNFCSFREPGLLWKLGIPFVWGPFGGTHNSPAKLTGHLNFAGACRERVRAVANFLQLRWSPRVGSALKQSAKVLVANRTIRDELLRARGVSAEVQLENGITEIAPPRPPRTQSRPLRILWSGRFASWKALPLLLDALALAGPRLRFELRVLGQGPRLAAWQQRAKELHLQEAITWIPWRRYRDKLPHYRWAEAFAFTSLRDTSGTGLLEALAAGAPIVGVDHQGARDIMTAACALRVPIASYEQMTQTFAEYLMTLAEEPQLWHQLSHGATERARVFTWDHLGRKMGTVYAVALRERISARDVAQVSLPAPLVPSSQVNS